MAPGVARGGGGGGRGRGRGGGRGHGRGDNGGGGDTQSQNTGESQPSFVSVRGSNILDQVPSDPKKRKFIEVESNDEYVNILKIKLLDNGDINANFIIVYFVKIFRSSSSYTRYYMYIEDNV